MACDTSHILLVSTVDLCRWGTQDHLMSHPMHVEHVVTESSVAKVPSIGNLDARWWKKFSIRILNYRTMIVRSISKRSRVQEIFIWRTSRYLNPFALSQYNPYNLISVIYLHLYYTFSFLKRITDWLSNVDKITCIIVLVRIEYLSRSAYLWYSTITKKIYCKFCSGLIG